MTGPSIAALELASPDPERLAAFYVQAFDAACVDGAVLLGSQTICFRRVPMVTARLALANATSFQHFAVVVADMQAAMARLGGLSGWEAITRGGPQHLPARSGGVTAFKFRDPDGHPLELLAFPAGSAPEIWRQAGGLFPGIDHTAITVLDTDRSVAFWRGLGFARVGGSVNTGVEQGALDGLDAPVVEVTSLAGGGAAPHVELLCYREPQGVADARDLEDVLATRIVLAGAAGSVVADPDGHRIAEASQAKAYRP